MSSHPTGEELPWLRHPTSHGIYVASSQGFSWKKRKVNLSRKKIFDRSGYVLHLVH